MSATLLHENPMTWPVLQEISMATSASVLHDIRRNVIPEVVGITSAQRGELMEAVHNRFCQLNAEHPTVNRKPRWS